MVLEQVRGTSTVVDEVKGGEYGLDLLVQAMSAHTCIYKIFRI